MISMPYCALSENGTQCQGCSREPSLRGSDLPPHPGISSLVRRGCSFGWYSLHLIVCPMVDPRALVSPKFSTARHCGKESRRQAIGRTRRRRNAEAVRPADETAPCTFIRRAGPPTERALRSVVVVVMMMVAVDVDPVVVVMMMVPPPAVMMMVVMADVDRDL